MQNIRWVMITILIRTLANSKHKIKLKIISCRQYKQCFKCVKDPSCGWCANECIEGTNSGPINSSCKYQWNYNKCTQEACNLYVDCISCVMNPYCGYCGTQQTCVNGNAQGPLLSFLPKYFKNSDISQHYQTCKSSWVYKNFQQNCYFNVPEKQRIAKKYENYIGLIKKYLNEKQALKDGNKKLKVTKMNDFGRQIILKNVKGSDLKKVLEKQNNNILNVYKNDLKQKEIRIDKPIFKEFNMTSFMRNDNLQNFTIKIQAAKVVNITRSTTKSKEDEYL